VLLWFLGGSFVAVWYVFRDPAIDYRLVMVGAVAPEVIDGLLGGARVLHSVVTAVAVLAVVMLATIGRRPLRRRLLALPIGLFLHLVLDAAFADTRAFWWPLSGLALPDSPLPSLDRSLLVNLVLEAVGLVALVWVYRRFGLADPDRRRVFWRTGRLDRALV
jgi:membrane-bound metal-dependent hydrolase YbcI (DUF457 family)